MGNACGCGSDSGPEKQVTQTDGELAGKAKFLSTPSFCEFSDTGNLLGAIITVGGGGGGSPAGSLANAGRSGSPTNPGGKSFDAKNSSGGGAGLSSSAPASGAGSGVASSSAATPAAGVSAANAAKWFLCVFAPLNGQGLSFTAYHAKSNTLLTRYLTDAEIIREKEAQNVSITYNMFFKALSTEVARAGRVGAKVSFVDSDTVALDCKIMIAGATSRRPDNFHVKLARVKDLTPEKLYSFVIEPVCTQYYKRRANEGWNVERVDVSREKIYGEYETNFILRSCRLDRNLDMLRELVPRVLQLRRDKQALRARRDALLAKLCVTRSLLAAPAAAATVVTSGGDGGSAPLRSERLEMALPLPDRTRRPAVLSSSSPASSQRQPSPASNATSSNSGESLYPTQKCVEKTLRLPRGIFLSCEMPNRPPPLPAVIPYAGSGAVSTDGGSQSNSAAAVLDDFLLNPSTSAQLSQAPKPREHHFISAKALELCVRLGSRLDADLREFEKKHPPQMAAASGSGGGGGGGPRGAGGSYSGVGGGSSPLLHGGGYSPGHRGSVDYFSNSTIYGDTNHGTGFSPRNAGASLPHQIPTDDQQGGDVNNDSIGGRSDVFNGQSFALPSEDYFIFDFSHFPEDIQKRFATLPGGEQERNAVFRLWRSFISVSRFDALIIDNMSGGHALALALAMALAHHRVVEDLRLPIEAVHDVCSRIEALHAKNDVFFNSARAADRVQFVSLFLKVVQSGEAPRLQNVPAIEKFCLLVAAAGCRVDLHPPLEPFSYPSHTLAALHIDSPNERHSLSVVVDALRKHAAVAKFLTPNVHALLSDFFLALDPARHGAILSSFLAKIRAATNFSRSLVERRLMMSLLLIGADVAFFARTPHIKDQWIRRLDNSVGSNSGGRFASVRLKSFSSARGGSKLAFGATGSGEVSEAGTSGSPIDASLTELRSPLKINLPSTFRIGAASGFGGAGVTAAQDDVSASCLVLRSETLAGGVGRAVSGSPGAIPQMAIPTSMQDITKKSHEIYEGVVTPVFSCLRTLAQDSLDAAKRAQNLGASETARDATYSVFARIAQCGLYGQ